MKIQLIHKHLVSIEISLKKKITDHLLKSKESRIEKKISIPVTQRIFTKYS